MSALEEAFRKVGFERPRRPILTALPRNPTRDPRRQPEQVPDFAAMDDATLNATILELRQDIAVISHELDADLEAVEKRSETWRHSAGRARAYKKVHLQFAEEEVARRKPPGPDPKQIAAIERAEAERLAHEAKAEAARSKQAEHDAKAAQAREEAERNRSARALVHEQMQALHAKRAARKARMFVMAAQRNMTPDEFGWFWNAARSMFPDAADWDESAEG